MMVELLEHGELLLTTATSGDILINDSVQAIRAGSRVVDFKYAQQKSLTSFEFSKYLKKRGITVEWEVLHHLWALGFVLPTAVTQLALDGTDGIIGIERFVKADSGHDEYFIDLGVKTEALMTDVPIIDVDSIPLELKDSLIWHPYQLIEIAALVDQLVKQSTIRFLFRDQHSLSQNYINNRDRTWEHIASEKYQRASEGNRRMVSVLIELDPMYRPFVALRHIGNSSTSYSDYAVWYQGQDPQVILAEMGISCDTVKEWHRDLSTMGQIREPFGPFAAAVRLGDRRSLERLKGDALLAQDYYDSAHILRITAQIACGMELDHELDVATLGPKVAGSAIERRIRARRLGISQEPLLVWFVEGQTEEGYVETFSNAIGMDLRSLGVRLHRANGTSYFSSAEFIELLHRYQAEKTYVYVSTDADPDRRPQSLNMWDEAPEPEHVSALRRLDEMGQLPAGMTIWDNNFVEANFSFDELADITNIVLAEGDVEGDVTGDLLRRLMVRDRDGVERERPITAEGAIEEVLKSKGISDIVKGVSWGKRLAHYAVAHPRSEPNDEDGTQDVRRINRDLHMLARARRSDYDLNVQTRPAERQKERDAVMAATKAKRKEKLAEKKRQSAS